MYLITDCRNTVHPNKSHEPGSRAKNSRIHGPRAARSGLGPKRTLSSSRELVIHRRTPSCSPGTVPVARCRYAAGRRAPAPHHVRQLQIVRYYQQTRQHGLRACVRVPPIFVTRNPGGTRARGAPPGPITPVCLRRFGRTRGWRSWCVRSGQVCPLFLHPLRAYPCSGRDCPYPGITPGSGGPCSALSRTMQVERSQRR